MGYIKNAVITFGKAQISAWIASFVDFAVTIILAQFAELWYGYSTFIGTLMGGITNCIINYKWVFHPDSINKRHVAARYMIVWTGSILLNTFGTLSLTEATGVSFIIVKAAVAVAVAVLWNYQMQRLFVFNGKLSRPLKKIINKKKTTIELPESTSSEAFILPDIEN